MKTNEVPSSPRDYSEILETLPNLTKTLYQMKEYIFVISTNLYVYLFGYIDSRHSFIYSATVEYLSCQWRANVT